jgi:hypothetical protein
MVNGRFRLTRRRGAGPALTLFCALALFLAPGAARSDGEEFPPDTYLTETEYRLISRGSMPLKLAHGFCDPGSFQVFVEGREWVEGEDFRVRARSGVVVPMASWVPAGQEAGAAGGRVLVVISYRYQPVGLPARLDLRPLGRPPGRDPSGAASPAGRDGPLVFQTPGTDSAWRDANLQVSGSKTVQVSSGNRRDMTVDQNLRLNIVGRLTDEIFVRAFLSDDNLPVVPEGNTEELKDIDKVLVEMTAPRWKATLGDFVANRSGTHFGNYRRKLQGFSLQATPGPAQVEVLAGSPRGRYRTLQIRGQESNQGPYYLGSGSTGENLFIVAGSERVSLDGELLVRGQDRDYIIDYVRGTITFTYRRLITSESSIVVEYEEGEGAFGRTVVGAGAGARFTTPGLGIAGVFSARLIREKDDPQRLRSGELDEDDLAVLARAGDDPLLAVAPGVTFRPDGQGDYDQGLSGQDTIYVHNAAGGDYDVTFFFVGPGKGNYSLDSITETGTKIYVHKGEGLGSYAIGRPLPMPEMQSVATLALDLGDTNGDGLHAEWNLSDQDLNQLSDLDNQNNQGTAGRIAGRLKSRELRVGGRALGKAGLEGYHEWQDAEFRGFMVNKTIFHYDGWGLSDRARREGFLDQDDRESGIAGNWKLGQKGRSLGLSGKMARLRHGENLEADRLALDLDWRLAGGRGVHRWQRAGARDRTDPLDIDHDNRENRLEWTLGPVRPSVAHKFRRWTDGAVQGDRAAGHRLEDLSLGLASAGQSKLDWRLGFTRGLADSLRAGNWRLEQESRTYSAGVTTDRLAGMRLVGETTVRQILSPGLPEQMTRLARLNLSGNWQKTETSWSLGYRVENSRTEVLDRQVIFVGPNQGDYNQDGDFVGQGQGDHNMVLAGTDSLVATTAVLADLNWRQGFEFLGKDRWYGSWNALTLAALEGRSTTDQVGRLLALDRAVVFDPEETVLGDFRFTEELILLKHLKTVDLRIKFDFREALDRQYADHPEDRLNRHWQVNSNVNLTARSSLRLRWAQNQEIRSSTESALSTRRSYDSLTRRYEAGWNIRPGSDLKLGLQGELITRAEELTLIKQTEYALRGTGRQRLRRKWTIQTDVRLAEVSSEEPVASIRPWFYAYPGRNVESSLRVTYEPSRFLSVSASWFARKQGDRRWQHDVRLESTARF